MEAVGIKIDEEDKDNHDREAKCNKCGKMGYRLKNCKTKPENKEESNFVVVDNMLVYIHNYGFLEMTTKSDDWVIDFGASQHICRTLDLFSEMK